MRKLMLALAATLAVGFVLPTAVSSPASAETIVVKRGGPGHHGGWRRPHRPDRVVVIKRRGPHNAYGRGRY